MYKTHTIASFFWDENFSAVRNHFLCAIYFLHSTPVDIFYNKTLPQNPPRRTHPTPNPQGASRRAGAGTPRSALQISPRVMSFSTHSMKRGMRLFLLHFFEQFFQIFVLIGRAFANGQYSDQRLVLLDHIYHPPVIHSNTAQLHIVWDFEILR